MRTRCLQSLNESPTTWPIAVSASQSPETTFIRAVPQMRNLLITEGMNCFFGDEANADLNEAMKHPSFQRYFDEGEYVLVFDGELRDLDVADLARLMPPTFRVADCEAFIRELGYRGEMRAMAAWAVSCCGKNPLDTTVYR